VFGRSNTNYPKQSLVFHCHNKKKMNRKIASEGQDFNLHAGTVMKIAVVMAMAMVMAMEMVMVMVMVIVMVMVMVMEMV
jgi:hypothetical protein